MRLIDFFFSFCINVHPMQTCTCMQKRKNKLKKKEKNRGLRPYQVVTPVPIESPKLRNVLSVQQLDGFGVTRLICAGGAMNNDSEVLNVDQISNSSWVR